MYAKKENTKSRVAALVAEAVKTYGEGSIVNRAQLFAIYDTDRQKYAHPYFYTCADGVKIGRGKFLVTAQSDIVAVREAKLKELGQEKTAESSEIADIKSNPASLAAVLMNVETKPKKKSEVTSKSGPKRDANGKFIKKSA